MRELYRRLEDAARRTAGAGADGVTVMLVEDVGNGRYRANDGRLFTAEDLPAGALIISERIVGGADEPT